ncbi:hypothetical protein GCM10023168_35290 [Fodinibacter luteus]|uniref:Uncharacterized protein n=1 Tax=Fodinibacter luteus TaxID=552064 RepID=A0ABP8KQJ1_9MICO
MKRASVVVVALVCAVFGLPPAAFAAGSYGAVVERGLRGCTTDDETGIVICFEAPSVNAESRDVFLEVWPAATAYFGWGRPATATMRVRSVSVTVATPRAGRTVMTYLARADRVLSLLECSDRLRFHSSNGTIRLQSLVSDCEAR